MTKAFCTLILHYSAARLSWTTVKSLHRNRNHHDDVTPVEYEILMGWTLLAFHSIYVSSGIEYILSFVIPFYYYFKLLVMGATFVLPGLTSLNPLKSLNSAESYGTNPLIVAWFNCLIVPGVQRIHEFMDRDPKRWALEQLSIMPFLLLDFFIVPGILLSGEERKYDQMKSSDDWTTEDTNDIPAPCAPPASLFQRDAMFPIKSSRTRNDDTDMYDDDHIMNSVTELNPRTTTNNYLHESPTRQQKTVPLNTPDRTPTSIFPRTTPTAGTPTNMHMASPVAKSRVASSTLRLRRFSREHEVIKTLSPLKLTPRLKKIIISENDDESDKNCRGDISTKKKQTSGALKGNLASNKNELSNVRRDRLSLGDHFRELVTGDANIRVRDHLFDLELPSVPTCPSPRHVSPPSYRVTRSRANGIGRSEVDSSNIITRLRRSSRSSTSATKY